MKKIMVLTSMRTGSTWVCLLLRIGLAMNFWFANTLDEAEEIWKSNRFVKAHRFTPEQVLERYPDAYIIAIVRNPKGRISSLFYFQPPYNEDRLKKILKNSLKWGEQKQLNRMWKGYSSKAKLKDRKPKYLWLTFEGLKEDTVGEFDKIARFLGFRNSKKLNKTIVDTAQRESKLFGLIRKGRIGSWKEESFEKELNALDKYQEMYYNIVKGEDTDGKQI